MTITFLDAGVLIVAFRGEEAVSQRALRILDDPEREFASSFFVRLEVLPKAAHFKNADEERFCQEYFKSVKHWAVPDEHLLESAFRHATEDGLNGMDALHVAAALAVRAHELVTAEKLTKSIHRTRAVAVRTIHM